VALSLLLHLWGLGERSYHHDEAIHSQAAFNLVKNGSYRYDPTYHGPLLYYLTAGTYVVLGDTDFTARLPVALAGVLLIAVAFSLRRPLGARAAWWTGLLATLSPITLYYGRFLRMDVLEMLLASAAGVAAWRAARGSPAAWPWFGLWVGLAFATKENAYVTSALVVAVWGAMAAYHGLRGAVPATLDWMWNHRFGIATSVAVAVVVTIPLYTVGFTFPEDWLFPKKAISYWWGQHSIERVAGPPWYHLPRLAAYEFLPIIAALAWAIRRGRRMRTLEWVLLLFAVGSVAMYAYLGEKVAWLGVHQVWAFLPLAGLQLARTFGPRGSRWGRALAGAGIAATVVVTVSANFVNDEISPNLERSEMLIYVQTSPEVVDLVNEGLALAGEGHSTVASVSGYAGWPLTWYWRTTPVRWTEPPADLRPPLVICEPDDEERIKGLLGPQYSSERIPFRSWWVIEHTRPTPGEILRWLFTRVPWGDIGSSDVIVFRHTGEPSAEAREIEVPAVLERELGVTSAQMVGEGWLSDPRALTIAGDGRLAVADTVINTILLFDGDGRHLDESPPEPMDRPEGVAWAPAGVLVVADTWSHRVLLYRSGGEGVRIMPPPEGGYFGPRGVAVSPDGAIAVSDTGNKRIVLYEPTGSDFTVRTIGGEGEAPGRLSEPVGLAWLDRRRLLVCDTGNHRVQILDRSGEVGEVVDLEGGWTDYYARPQATVLGDGRVLVSDTPGRSLWLIEGGRARRIELREAGIAPTGLAWRDGVLYLGDTAGRVWRFELEN
jgi:uncharacterized protein (TIGR03663 family)